MATATPCLRTIRPSLGEIANRRLRARTLEAALEALHHDGIVVIEEVVDTVDIDRLNESMLKDTKVLVARGKDGPFNYNLGNLQQSPPYEPDVFAQSIFTNSIASQVTRSWLGGTPTMSFISSNVALKADQGQPVHSDADFRHPTVSTLLFPGLRSFRSPSPR